jgi:hypothetical protein
VFCIFVFRLTTNGLGIAAMGEFENRQPNVCTKVDSSTNDQLLPSAPIVAIPCYGHVLLFQLSSCYVRMCLLSALSVCVSGVLIFLRAREKYFEILLGWLKKYSVKKCFQRWLVRFLGVYFFVGWLFIRYLFFQSVIREEQSLLQSSCHHLSNKQ